MFSLPSKTYYFDTLENDAEYELGSSGPIFKGQGTTDMVYKHCAMYSTLSEKNQQRRLESPRTGNNMYVCCTAKIMLKTANVKEFVVC